jgi:hypothetical protein
LLTINKKKSKYIKIKLRETASISALCTIFLFIPPPSQQSKVLQVGGRYSAAPNIGELSIWGNRIFPVKLAGNSV